MDVNSTPAALAAARHAGELEDDTFVGALPADPARWLPGHWRAEFEALVAIHRHAGGHDRDIAEREALSACVGLVQQVHPTVTRATALRHLHGCGTGVAGRELTHRRTDR